MKTSDAELLAAAARQALGATAVRGASEVLELADHGFLDLLAAGVSASVRQFETEPRTEQTRPAVQHDAQLLAAAHAVAAYWLTSSQASSALVSPAAESGGAQPMQPSLPPAVTISVNHVTPEGGLAAVELVHPELGALALEVSLSGHTLSVLATAETERAAAAIREGHAALAQQLQGQGIQLQALSVVVLRRRVKPPEPKSKRQES